MALKCTECPNWGCPNRNLATDECTVESFKTTATNTLKGAKKEDTSEEKECQLVKLAYEWWEEHGCVDIDVLDGYVAGYKQALEHPTGGELLYVLNKGHKQGWKDAIEKACEWLAERMWEMNSPADDMAYVVDGVSSSISEFIRNFKDYMEEQQ